MQVVWAVCNAMVERKRWRFPRIPSRSLQARQTGWGNMKFIHGCSLICMLNTISLRQRESVPAKQRTHPVFDVGGGHLHATRPVFWCRVETRMSGSRNLETLHETIRQDDSQSIACLRRHGQKGIPTTDKRRANRKLTSHWSKFEAA